MPLDHPKPICSFLVQNDGSCSEIVLDQHDAIKPVDGSYVWHHFDIAEPGVREWFEATLPLTVASALAQQETRPRCDRVEDGMLLNLRGVNLNPGSNSDDMVSIRLWVTEGRIISARARKIFAVDSIRQRMAEGSAPNSVSSFLVELSYGLTKRIEKASLELVEATDALEEHSLESPTKVATELAALRQMVIKIRRFVRPQNEAIADLAAGEVWPLEEKHCVFLLETANRTRRTLEELDSTADRLQAIQDHVDVLQSAALGKNSYILSVVAAIFLPLGFLTGLFGINVGGMPGVENILGFWIVTGGSILIGFLLFFVFRQLKWL